MGELALQNTVIAFCFLFRAQLQAVFRDLLTGLVLAVLAAALLLSRGDPSVFVTRPISCGLLIAAAILLILVLAPSIRKKREVAFQDDD